MATELRLPNTLRNITSDGVLAYTDQIFDKKYNNKNQETINGYVKTIMEGDGGVEGAIDTFSKIKDFLDEYGDAENLASLMEKKQDNLTAGKDINIKKVGDSTIIESIAESYTPEIVSNNNSGIITSEMYQNWNNTQSDIENHIRDVAGRNDISIHVPSTTTGQVGNGLVIKSNGKIGWGKVASDTVTGDAGKTYKPEVDADGNLKWVLFDTDSSLPNTISGGNIKGIPGESFTFDDLTENQKEQLKGEPGVALTFDMLTPSQKEQLKGKTGADGTDGDSAYQIWLKNGHDGTESDFLLSLKGEKGDSGDKGDSASVLVDYEDGILTLTPLRIDNNNNITQGETATVNLKSEYESVAQTVINEIADKLDYVLNNYIPENNSL